MTTDRIKEIQDKTAHPDSISVQQALLKVWNETEQEQLRLHNVVGQSEQLKAFLNYCDEAGWIKNIEKDRIIKDYTKIL